MTTILTWEIRLLATLPALNPRKAKARRRGSPTYLLIVLGSGGHTAEMLMILRDLDSATYGHRRYVLSSGDGFSERKALEFETSLAEKADRSRTSYGSFDIKVVPRARKIHQSLLTAPFSVLVCLWACIKLLLKAPRNVRRSGGLASRQLPRSPDLIMANGPATATTLIIAAFLCRFLGLAGSKSMRCLYVESWARVKKLSLSGELLWRSGICDRVLVQWPGLAEGNDKRPARLEFKGAFVS